MLPASGCLRAGLSRRALAKRASPARVDLHIVGRRWEATLFCAQRATRKKEDWMGFSTLLPRCNKGSSSKNDPVKSLFQDFCCNRFRCSWEAASVPRSVSSRPLTPSLRPGRHRQHQGWGSRLGGAIDFVGKIIAKSRCGGHLTVIHKGRQRPSPVVRSGSPTSASRLAECFRRHIGCSGERSRKHLASWRRPWRSCAGR